MMDRMRRLRSCTQRVLAVLAAVLLATSMLGGCQQPTDGPRLTITTGSPKAVYGQLGTTLASAWTARIDIAPPTVLTSAGSGQNLDRLLGGQADVGFSAADEAALRAARPGGAHLRALARMHDDYLQVVVPANSRVERLSDLRGLRVSVGAPDSGVQLIADRLLASAGLSGTTDIHRQQLSIDQSADALARGDTDAFFWSGGLPTEQISALAHRMPIRLVDLSDILPAVRGKYQEYGSAVLPVSAYHLPRPVATLVVRNFLLVTDRMPARVAEALTRVVFDAQPALAAANQAARSIDVRSGIETIPIPLHPGALDYYRATSL
jgi:TRAP transporter TAXI family solute receptor